MKISLGSWAFSFGPFADNPIPFEKTVKRLSSAGYDGIEICGFPPHVTQDKYPSAESRKELVKFLQDHKLGVSGYAADFTSVNPVAAGNKQKYLDLFQRNVQMCADIGSPAIRVDSIAAPGSIEEILSMHTKVAHPNFRLMFDTSHAYMCAVVGARQHGARETLPGGVAEFLKKLEGRIGAIHLIDSDGTLHGDETSTHRPFGEGFIDFKSLAPQLLAVPNIQWWCIDMCFWAGSWELVESSLGFIRNLLGVRAAA